MARRLALLAAALLVPACGGGGGAGGGSVSPPADPGPLAPLPLVDTSMPDTVIDTTQPAAAVRTQLQNALTAGGVIVFNNAGPYTLTLTAELSLPDLQSAVIDGGGTVTLSGGNAVRILSKAWRTHLTVQRLAFVDARAAQSGAAINEVNWDGSMTAIQCTFTNCRTTSPGPDIGGGAMRMTGQRTFRISECTFTDCDGSNGGAVNSLGCQLTIIASTFTDCDAFGTGGGADQGPTGQGGIGGAIYVDGVSQNAVQPRLDVSGCTFTDNTANDHGGAVFAYTIAGTGSQTVFDTCTFDNNRVLLGTAVGFGGAIYQQENAFAVRRSTFVSNDATDSGGALWSSCAAGEIANCSFQGNRSEGGAFSIGGAMTISGAFTLNALTLSQNHAADWGGGIFTGSAGTVTLRNTILDRNTGTNPFNGWNSNATLVDGGNNLQWPTNRPPSANLDTPATATVVFADAQPGALAANGGPTRTMSLPMGSPAVNAGNAGAPLLDQRGFPRVGAPDVGAFERQ